MRYGYARVSTDEQKTHAQTDALRDAGCDVILEEKRSGGTMARPVLLKLLSSLQRGDVVIVYKMDRIARSLRDLMTIQERVHSAGADFKSLTEVIDTTSPAGRMIFQILGAFAEFERAIIRERTTVGLHAAMERGAKPGQPRKISDDKLPDLVKQWESGAYTKSALAHLHGCHIASVKRALLRANSLPVPQHVVNPAVRVIC
jgi:DNA invertase Pin-like site-specific DNA recombinase